MTRALKTVLGMAFVFAASGFTVARSQPDESTLACPQGDSTHATCAAHILNMHAPYSSPVGLTPAQLLKAYDLPSTYSGSTIPIIAVIGAYDAPDIIHDFAHYSQTFGIPSLPTCQGAIVNSAVPCFQKVDQRGGKHYPKGDSWHLGLSLEVESAHAICQNCSVLLVESDDNFTNNMYPATDEAATLGARFIDTAYYLVQDEDQNIYDSFDYYFNIPNVVFVGPEGEYGYGQFVYPTASRYVTAVGSTALTLKKNGAYQSESVSSFTTSYCDQYESKPLWQHDRGCADRIGADLAMVGDDTTGFAMYDSTDHGKQNGWYLTFGTALSSSLVTAVFALANHSEKHMNALPYQHYSWRNFHDIAQGSNGSCDIGYFCNAKKGYDGPSGLGSPKGIGGF